MLKYDKPGLIVYAKTLGQDADTQPFNFGLKKEKLNWKNYRSFLFEEGDFKLEGVKKLKDVKGNLNGSSNIFSNNLDISRTKGQFGLDGSRRRISLPKIEKNGVSTSVIGFRDHNQTKKSNLFSRSWDVKKLKIFKNQSQNNGEKNEQDIKLDKRKYNFDNALQAKNAFVIRDAKQTKDNFFENKLNEKRSITVTKRRSRSTKDTNYSLNSSRSMFQADIGMEKLQSVQEYAKVLEFGKGKKPVTRDWKSNWGEYEDWASERRLDLIARSGNVCKTLFELSDKSVFKLLRLEES